MFVCMRPLIAIINSRGESNLGLTQPQGGAGTVWHSGYQRFLGDSFSLHHSLAPLVTNTVVCGCGGCTTARAAFELMHSKERNLFLGFFIC